VGRAPVLRPASTLAWSWRTRVSCCEDSDQLFISEAPYFFEERFEQLFRWIAALLADHAHDGLGLADAHVEPAAGPIDAQTVEHAHAPIAIAFAQIHQQGWNALRHQRHLPFQNRIFGIRSQHLAQRAAAFVQHGKDGEHGGDAVVDEAELRHHHRAGAFSGQRDLFRAGRWTARRWLPGGPRARARLCRRVARRPLRGAPCWRCWR
jgi:hypothetical protein